MADNRRGIVTQTSTGQVVISYAGWVGSSSPPIGGNVSALCRPIVGSTLSGLHYQPVAGTGNSPKDELIALAEVDGWKSATVSVGNPALMPVLAGGETAIYAIGVRVFYTNALGTTVALTTSTAGSIALNATSTGTLTFTGAATFNQNLTVSGTTILSGTVEQAASTPTWTISSAGAFVATSLNAGSGTIQTTGSISGGTITATTSSSLGAATATSLALNGATLGANKLAVNGTSALGGDTTIVGKLYRTPSGAPTVAHGAGFSAASLSSGNDERGRVTATVGSTLSSISAIVLATVTFATAYASQPYVTVCISSGNAVAFAATQSVGTSSFQILFVLSQTTAPITSGTVITVDYIVSA